MSQRDLFSSVSPTYIENWPTGLYALSIPHAIISLSADQVLLLYQYNRTFRSYVGFDEQLHALRQPLQMAIDSFPAGAFIRLGSRSAKDSFHAVSSGLFIATADDALLMLTSGSKRLAHDLLLAMHCHYQPCVIVRAWQSIPAWAEFRCFMKDRKLVGISQYDCVNLGSCPLIHQYSRQIHDVIEDFFIQFSRLVLMDTVVFDVFITISDSEKNIEVILLELNPFIKATDSGLFNWNDTSDFDGSFRYL